MNKPSLTEQSVRNLVFHWYRLLDMHAESAQLGALLSQDGLSMVFPEATLHSNAEFNTWYEGVVRVFFDEVHDLKELDIIVAADGLTAEVALIVRWLARRWKAPAAKSEWLGFDAIQRWSVGLSQTGHPAITKYIVDSLTPMAGSAAL
jgi:hypothetical protein